MTSEARAFGPVLILIFLSIAGLPPFAGFFVKLQVLSDAM
jgi:NADH:ubiquinone oxidoreductase subunit 2 (subunit N)